MKSQSFDRLLTAVSSIAVLLLLCLPLVAVYWYQSDNPGLRAATSDEVTVGIAVILRATVRRFMRTASNQFMRSAFGVVGRASARTATRRIVKAATKLTVATAVRGHEEDAPADGSAEQPASQPALLALGLGAVALGLSFWGILAVVSDDVVSRLLHDGGIAVLTACVFVAMPLLVYSLCHLVFGRLFAVRITYRTAIDGLLLQGYFTGSGSFLPMTTDVDYAGSDRGKCWVATCALFSMLAIHVALMLIAQSTGNIHIEFLGAAFLVYAFIYVFPITPLEGKFIWSQSKTLWFLVAIPILAAFLYFLPVSFGEVL